MQNTYQQLDAYLRRRTPRQILWGVILLLIVMGGVDRATGFEMTFSFFYLIPIAIATLYAGFRNGMFVTLLSVFIWATSNRMAGQEFSSEWVRYWNSGIRLVTFSLIAYLLDQLNQSIQHQTRLSRTDFLTGANNPREFYRLAEMEMEQARRRGLSFSIAYLDLDNFKKVNDKLGHNAGDELLRLIARTVSSNIRKGDVFARLGGDEFALLLPGTDQTTVRGVVEKVRQIILDDLHAVHAEVSVSIGAVTFTHPPASVDALVQSADALMYEVKARGKDGVIYRVMEG